MAEPAVWIVSGEIGSGKTTFCRRIADRAREAGFRVAGVLSPGEFEEGVKTGIRVVDLSRGESRQLARRRSERSRELETQRWAFDPDAVDWGNRILERVFPCDLLIVDELGPLEFERDQGWTKGFQALDKGHYRAALVVVRPHLVEQARGCWPGAKLLFLPAGEDHAPAADRILRFLEVDRG